MNARLSSFAPMEPPASLEDLLHRWFGFEAFRPNQEEVCRAALAGRDVLLVMPTGSGKSLCYQLPGLASGGVTLVVSPLIALMEDQVAKLEALGMSVDRIHSGRDRQESRHASFNYLEGKLQFLFVAPERFRVAGFAQMLAKRKPALIAIDEAHCISQWGHDFRPDYRMLGQYIPMLRPTPVMAVTATATRVVQADIARQLGLLDPLQSIGGFRRDNIAIEIVEVAPSGRGLLVNEILEKPESRPAIIYAPTRKATDELASELSSKLRAAPYHAGLEASRRAAVQERFLGGKLDVIVATIAFGMGIDKPDVRTVIHTGLPGSIEGYYQEIGRAGRDGGPSRAILMQSYSDRHTHDFFFDRDYPDVRILDRLYGNIGSAPVAKNDLKSLAKAPEEVFEKALEKLWAHGGALVDYAENIIRGKDEWRDLYLAQSKHRSDQLELMLRYVSAHHCRMAAIVHYFGDSAEARKSCGHCDYCLPSACVAQRFRSLESWERTAIFKVLHALRVRDGSTSGQLYKELYTPAEVTRKSFEAVLGAMARAGLIKIVSAVFEKDGESIPYRKVSLTAEGRSADESTPLDVVMNAGGDGSNGVRRAKRTPRSKSAPAADPVVSQKASPELVAKLRAWRLEEAKRLGLPAFRICTDQVLHAIALEEPAADSDLLAIKGIGRHFVEKYGRDVYRLMERDL